MLKSLKKLWRFIKQNEVIKGLLYVSIIPPVVLALFRFGYDRIVEPYDSNWFGFFGSYLGGLLGGIATLIAVIYTIKSNVAEQDRKEKNEKQKEIRKSALIVYYDFKFVFKNIEDFLYLFSSTNESKGKKYPIKKLCDKKDVEVYRECLIKLNQFYFDDNWIHTVANLHDPTLLAEGTIKKIYEIYGHLSNIYKSIERPEDDVIKNAFESMNDIFEYKYTEYRGRGITNYDLREGTKAILNSLENIAFQYDSRMMSAKFVKNIIVDLFDQLIVLVYNHKDKDNPNDARTTDSKEAVNNILVAIAGKYQFDIPKSEQLELDKEVMEQLNLIAQNTSSSDTVQARIKMRCLILPILQKHGYPSAPREVFDDINIQLMSSEKAGDDQGI